MKFNFNILLYKIAFKLFGYEGIKTLITNDTREKTLILKDLFHAIINFNLTERNNFVNKIKNKELNIPIINNDFIHTLSNIEKIRQKIIKLIEQNNTSKLTTYFIKHNLDISFINHEKFDLLIYAIQNNTSIVMIKTIISLYKSLNYGFDNKNNDNSTALNNIIDNSIDFLMDDTNDISIRLSYLSKILDDYEKTNKNNYYYTPLYCAISNNKFSVAKELLKNGASINFKLNEKDLISSLIIENECNKENLKFIFRNCSFINLQGIVTVINKIIKEKDKINDIFNIIIPCYFNKVFFILNLLLIYKNNFRLSRNQLQNLLLTEESKIPVEWLFQAIDKDELDLVVTLVNIKININKKSINGDSPLFRALKINSKQNYNEEDCIDKNNIKIVSYLIKNKADVNEILNNGDSLLTYAIKRNNICIVKDLISYGADIYNQKLGKNGGDTAITAAIKSGRDDIIKYIIEYALTKNLNRNDLLQDSNLINLSIENCNENITSYLIEKGIKIDNKIVMANAIYMDYSNATMKYLIEHGADVNKEGNCKKIPLHIAFENKNEDLAKYLIDHGASTDDPKILWVAVINNISKTTIKYLIEHNINIINPQKSYYYKNVPIIKAIEKNSESIVKLLVDYGIEINFNYDTPNYSPLGLAFKKRNENIIKYLIEHGADINANLFDEKPLTLALKSYNESFIKYIIDKGADVNYHDKFNQTPLFYAVDRGSETIIKYLIDHGATACSDVNIVRACRKKLSESIIFYLIDHGCNLKVYNRFDGPIITAINNNYSISVIKSMIDHKANVNEQIIENFNEIDTPLRVAVRKRKLNIIDYLREKGANIKSLKRIKERPFITTMDNNTKKIKNFLIKHINDENDKKKKINSSSFSSSSSSSSSLSLLSLLSISSLSSLSEKYNNNLSDILFQYLINEKKKKKKKNNDNELVNEKKRKKINDNDNDLINGKKKKKNNDNDNDLINGKKRKRKMSNEDNIDVKVSKKKKKDDEDIDLDEYLIEAIENNYNEILVRSIIDHGANVNHEFSLIKAINNNYSETIIQSIIKHGADVNGKDENGVTPLTLALTNASERVIKMIIDHGADVNEQGKNGQYPLNISIEYCNESIVQYLIHHGAKVRKSTPILEAIKKSFNEEIILYLIEHEANIQPCELLNVAFDNNYSNTILKSLIDHGANLKCDKGITNNVVYVNDNDISYIYRYLNKIKPMEKNNGKVILANAIDRNNEELIRYVITNGLNNINEIINHRSSLLGLAINNNCSMELIQYMVEHCKNEIDKINESYYTGTAVNEAFSHNDLSLITYLNENGFHIYNSTVISKEIYYFNDNIIKYLIHHNPEFFNNNISVLTNMLKGKKDYSFIHCYEDKNKEIVKYIINHNIINEISEELLVISIKENDQDFIEYLLRHRIPVGINSLNKAVKKGNLDLVKYLINYGVNINQSKKQENSPLVTAIENKQLKIIEYLVDHGANLKKEKDKSGNTLLRLAIDLKNIDILNYLLHKNIDLEINDENHSPLTYAIKTKDLTIVKCIVDYYNENPNLNQSMNSFINLGIGGKTPLIMAIELKNINMVKYLVEHGANPTLQINENMDSNPLICAMKNSKEDILRYLIEKEEERGRGNIISQIDQKYSLICYAIKNLNTSPFEITKYLIEHNMNINKKNEDGNTPLMLAIHRYYLEVEFIKYLIDHGADVNAEDNFNETALMHIIDTGKRNERNAIIRCLINHGANLNKKDRYGKSILQLAQKKCTESIINYLIKHGAKN